MPEGAGIGESAGAAAGLPASPFGDSAQGLFVIPTTIEADVVIGTSLNLEWPWDGAGAGRAGARVNLGLHAKCRHRGDPVVVRSPEIALLYQISRDN
jgi:hypothetical protein